jgi:anti-anti-sigma regulatory factor
MNPENTTPLPGKPEPQAGAAAPLPGPAEPPPANFIEVALAGPAVIIRPVGLGNMKVALGMMDFTTEMLHGGHNQFVFDLSACKGLDSTFMGAMVGLAAAAQEEGGSAVVVNAGQDNLELLQIVGADKFLKLHGEYKMEALEMERLEVTPPSPGHRLELVKKAHENLVVIDKRNEARFGAFLRQLSSELAKE